MDAKWLILLAVVSLASCSSNGGRRANVIRYIIERLEAQPTPLEQQYLAKHKVKNPGVYLMNNLCSSLLNNKTLKGSSSVHLVCANHPFTKVAFENYNTSKSIMLHGLRLQLNQTTPKQSQNHSSVDSLKIRYMIERLEAQPTPAEKLYLATHKVNNAGAYLINSLCLSLLSNKSLVSSNKTDTYVAVQYLCGGSPFGDNYPDYNSTRISLLIGLRDLENPGSEVTTSAPTAPPTTAALPASTAPPTQSPTPFVNPHANLHLGVRKIRHIIERLEAQPTPVEQQYLAKNKVKSPGLYLHNNLCSSLLSNTTLNGSSSVRLLCANYPFKVPFENYNVSKTIMLHGLHAQLNQAILNFSSDSKKIQYIIERLESQPTRAEKQYLATHPVNNTGAYLINNLCLSLLSNKTLVSSNKSNVHAAMQYLCGGSPFGNDFPDYNSTRISMLLTLRELDDPNSAPTPAAPSTQPPVISKTTQAPAVDPYANLKPDGRKIRHIIESLEAQPTPAEKQYLATHKVNSTAKYLITNLCRSLMKNSTLVWQKTSDVYAAVVYVCGISKTAAAFPDHKFIKGIMLDALRDMESKYHIVKAAPVTVTVAKTAPPALPTAQSTTDKSTSPVKVTAAPHAGGSPTKAPVKPQLTTRPPTPPPTSAAPVTTNAPTSPSRLGFAPRRHPAGFVAPSNNYRTLDEFKKNAIGPRTVETRPCHACFTGPSIPANGSAPNPLAVQDSFLFCHGRFTTDISVSLQHHTYLQRCVPDSKNRDNVRAFYFKNAQFNKFAAKSLASYPNLDTLVVSGGKLTQVEHHALHGIHKLTFLDLSMNKLTGFDLKILSGQKHLSFVNLTGNPIDCSKVCVHKNHKLDFNKDVRIAGKCHTYTPSSKIQFVSKDIQSEFLSCYGLTPGKNSQAQGAVQSHQKGQTSAGKLIASAVQHGNSAADAAESDGETSNTPSHVGFAVAGLLVAVAIALVVVRVKRSKRNASEGFDQQMAALNPEIQISRVSVL